MIIKSSIYDSLTPRQRVIASIEALARGDKTEHEKLLDTCPKKRYLLPDDEYSGTLEGLTSMSIAIELDMTRYALSFLMIVDSGKEGLEDACLQKIINIHTAWNRQMETMGIDPKTVKEKVKDIRHFAVDAILRMMDNEEDMPKADEAAVKKYLGEFGNFFKKFRH